MSTACIELVQNSRMIKDESQLDYAKYIVSSFADEVVNGKFGEIVDCENLIIPLQKRIAEIDQILTDQINEILHHPEFQKLEASWLGLHKFVCNTETGRTLKIKLLSADKNELLKDIEKALDFDQSALFKKVYEEEYGTFGGDPFSLLIGDYFFSKSPKDIALLEGISHVAAAAHAPFISSCNPNLFEMDCFTEMPNPRDLVSLFETSGFLSWNSFRNNEDSKYVTLTLPRVMQRLPYGKGYLEVDEFNFEESMNGADHTRYLWGNPAYVLGNRITSAFTKYSWCAAIRGVEGGGLVDNLPVYTYISPAGDREIKCPTEVIITDRREKELSDLGFIALCYRKNSNQSVFFGGQTVAKVKEYEDPVATANANIALQLPYILAASRFAHYLKVIMRDKIGSFTSLGEISIFLNNWISHYVLLNDYASQSVKASYPLREARIDVYEIPGKPGCYRSVCFLRPHYQLNELTVSIRFVSELPPPAAG
ncbi:type VI secretion system contractile sheath large subunit [Pigmentibacter sp. JX0631]|uniref:type VI secretion system contractile sheath large subunit n=1 Tax=Pigmentibacter sp. JX0631 TaxID=2976982 RepID=UPI00246833E0|nr:type VI secretion system contractile sheath large subunit [Pigmentibacter sp. JX0631]WGL60326.1 type VI secretion system contractile sheath large subunit [Pigmentibacter sp. JX0631]